MIIAGDECLTVNRKPVLKFSKSFLQEVSDLEKTGYKLKNANVNFVVYWQKEADYKEIKIVLPEVYFERVT